MSTKPLINPRFQIIAFITIVALFMLTLVVVTWLMRGTPQAYNGAP